MKQSRILCIIALLALLLLGSCRSHKDISQGGKPVTSWTDSAGQAAMMERVVTNRNDAEFVSSKLKFSVQVGDKDVSLSGSLRMKRDDVIRIQLVAAFGLVEVARLEFTTDEVLMMDRINKQYIKVPYSQVDFLNNSGINFYTLQALFRNELFHPGKTTVDETVFANYALQQAGAEEALLEMQNKKMHYSWLVNETTGRILTTNITYLDNRSGNTQMNWEYRDFKKLLSKPFPSDMKVTLKTPDKEVQVTFTLNGLDSDSGWETRTNISSRYKKVTPDDILARILSL